MQRGYAQTASIAVLAQDAPCSVDQIRSRITAMFSGLLFSEDLLVEALRDLQSAGVVARNGATYSLSATGMELYKAACERAKMSREKFIASVLARIDVEIGEALSSSERTTVSEIIVELVVRVFLDE